MPVMAEHLLSESHRARHRRYRNGQDPIAALEDLSVWIGDVKTPVFRAEPARRNVDYPALGSPHGLLSCLYNVS